MRNLAILLTATALAACGGGAQSVSGTATVGGAAAGGGTTTTTNAPYTQFAAPTVTKTYSGIGGSQAFDYITDTRFCCGQQGQTFGANTSTVRSSGIQISYDPSNAVFTLVVNDPNSGANAQTRFQDPASRTNFGGAVEPQWGVPNLANTGFRYLQAGDGNPLSPHDRSGTGLISDGTNSYPVDGTPGSTYQSTNLFYELPTTTATGTSNRYVSLAGYIRNSISWTDLALPSGGTTKQVKWHLERGAFAYGMLTDQAAVPKTGSGTYTGTMLATMVYNPTFDGSYGAALPTFFQWIEGTSTTTVDFATSAVTLGLTGTATAPAVDYAQTRDASGNLVLRPYSSPVASTIAAGATFTASGTATINLVTTGGFTGQFGSAGFSATTNGAPTSINIAGSTINGAFFGPVAEEVGGGFHIVGGTPDQRIDIVGAFKGKKP